MLEINRKSRDEHQVCKYSSIYIHIFTYRYAVINADEE